VPWAIRNQRVFHFFQPLSPAHAEMPGEFVPRGYLTWVRTWIDDGSYIGSTIWALDTIPIKLASFPDSAFDSADEKQRVSALLDKYNHTPEEPGLFTDERESNNPRADDQSQSDEKSETGKSDETDEAAGDEDDGKDDEGDETDDNAPADEAGEGVDQEVEMTPEIDAGFAQLARERIAHHPFRYYVSLPLKRSEERR